MDFILHIDKQIAEFVATYGTGTYAIIFLIIFCETGLIVAPFLPGDSLLFAAGSLAALGSLDPHLLFVLITVAAIIGDFVNYSIGKFSGDKILASNSRFIKRENIEKTDKFYEKHGGKTIILARFIPIVRTFAPFVAGTAKMNYRNFLIYNVVGAILWAGIFVYAGYFFGNIPVVKNNFKFVVLGIIVISVLPIVIELGKSILRKKAEQQA